MAFGERGSRKRRSGGQGIRKVATVNGRRPTRLSEPWSAEKIEAEVPRQRLTVITSVDPTRAPRATAWAVTSGGAAVASGWIDVASPPAGRGHVRRLPDGSVGIYVGTASDGRIVLCSEPARFHRTCCEFDATS